MQGDDVKTGVRIDVHSPWDLVHYSGRGGCHGTPNSRLVCGVCANRDGYLHPNDGQLYAKDRATPPQAKTGAEPRFSETAVRPRLFSTGARCLLKPAPLLVSAQALLAPRLSPAFRVGR